MTYRLRASSCLFFSSSPCLSCLKRSKKLPSLENTERGAAQKEMPIIHQQSAF